MKPGDYIQWTKGGIVHIVSLADKRWKWFFTYCGHGGRVMQNIIFKYPAPDDICKRCLQAQTEKERK